MSEQHPPRYPAHAAAYRPPQTNNVGLTGFILSIAGLVVCGGLLCPIGLIVSLFGINKEPRGFAIAGVVIGLAGSLFGAGMGFLIYNAYNNSNFFNTFGYSSMTSSTMWTASSVIDNYYMQNQNTLPDQATGTALMSSWLDEWNTPIQYRPIPGSTTDYELVSAGPDQQFGTNDDYVEQIPVAGGWSSGFDIAVDEGPGTEQIDFTFDQASVAIGSAFPPNAAMPDEATGNSIIANLRDAWGRPIRYKQNNPPYYLLKSAGPDGVWDNEDDIARSFYFEPTASP